MSVVLFIFVDSGWDQGDLVVFTMASVLGVYCNIRSLEDTNVETVSIFRSYTPLAVAIGDYLFMNRNLLTFRSIGCLIGCTVGKLKVGAVC